MGNPQSQISNPKSAGLPSPPDGWAPTSRAAKIFGRSASSLRAQCQAGKLPARLCAGTYGPEWFIDPAAIPVIRIAGGDLAAPAVVDSPLAGLSRGQRGKIYKKFSLVERWLADLAAKPANVGASEWLDRWLAAQQAMGHAVRRSALYDWQAKIAAGGIAALADRRGGVAASDWSRPALQFIVGQYADQSRPSIKVCFERAEAVAASQGWTLPTLATIRRHVRRTIDPKLLTAGRDPRRFRDRCLPDMRRDWSRISAMELWVADHRQLDVWVPRRVLVDQLVKGRKTGRKVAHWGWYRPWLTHYIDAATWMPIAWDIRFESPDANQVMSVFCRGVQVHGKPAHLYLDNGKDFRAKRFAGGRVNRSGKPLDEKAITPILEMLDIAVTWAIPYNAKAKTIEPWFRLMSERFDKTFETYLGNKPERKPERIKKMTGRAEHFYQGGLSIDAVAEAFTRWCQDDFSHRECPVPCRKPLSTAEAFSQCRAEGFIQQRPAEADLALLLMPSKRVVVSKNGIYVAHHDRLYWSDALLDRAAASGRDRRRQIVYRYRADDDSVIYVFDAETGKFLCNATPFTGDRTHPIAPPGSPEAQQVADAMELKNHVAKAIRRQGRELKKASFEVLLSAQRDGAEAGGRLADPPVALPHPTIVQITPEISQAAAQAAGDKAESDSRREGRSRLRDFLDMTGTDGADNAPAKPAANTAMDILADLVHCGNRPDARRARNPF